ncbi:MAG: hypothetical protein ACFBSC_17480 [Microcoleaceae cyanobacterium]
MIDNLLHCLQHGTHLGWLIDLDDRSILVFPAHQQPEIKRDLNEQLAVLEGIELELFVGQVFDWLKMGV